MARPIFKKIDDKTFSEEAEVPASTRATMHKVNMLEARLRERTGTKDAIDAEIEAIKELLKEAKKLGMIVKDIV